MRAQVLLGIVFLWFLGLRPGEMIESKEHLDNEGLCWKDFQISMQTDQDGQRLFQAKVSIRNRKNVKHSAKAKM